VNGHITDIFDPELLEGMLGGGYIHKRVHPELELVIYNYSARAQFENVWNPATRACRGLITDAHGAVLARPFEKFFNLEQTGHLPANEAVEATEKLDGSLGVLYPVGRGYRVATRGSFESDQAYHATSIWDERYAEKAKLDPRLTYLCEIIYPGNRIVVDYSGLDDLLLIGAVETATGRSLSLAEAEENWPGNVVERVSYSNAEEVLAAGVRLNREGVVLHYLDSGLRVKVKYPEYVRLHRLVTGVSERRIWELLTRGERVSQWLDSVPDEFHAFAVNTEDALLARYENLKSELAALLEEVRSASGDTRAEFAREVGKRGEHPLSRALFAAHDGKDTSEFLWQQLRPAAHEPFFSRSGDVE
jgi:RNA ligase